MPRKNCKWKIVLFSDHHGMEPPTYRCSVCGKEIKGDYGGSNLPKIECQLSPQQKIAALTRQRAAANERAEIAERELAVVKRALYFAVLTPVDCSDCKHKKLDDEGECIGSCIDYYLDCAREEMKKEKSDGVSPSLDRINQA